MGLGGSSARATLAGTLRTLAGAALRATGADLGRDFGAEGGLFGVAIRVKLSGRRK
jgi:hypothetical protein